MRESLCAAPVINLCTMAASPKTKVVFVKTLWAVTEVLGNTPADGGYARLFRRIKADGFSAVETPVWMIADKAAFCAALKETGLDYVAMVNTCHRPTEE